MKPEKLSIPEFIAISQFDHALDLRGINNTTPRSKINRDQSISPTGIADFNFDSDRSISPSIVEQQVDSRIDQLEVEGVTKSPLPEVNSTSVGGFLSNMTDYVARTIAIPTAVEILEARKGSKNARILAQIPNVLADEVFEVISAGGDFKNMPYNIGNRLLWGGGTFLAAKITDQMRMNSDKPTKLASRALSQGMGVQGGLVASAATYVGGELGLSKDDADNLGNIALGTMRSGDLSKGFANASEKILFKEGWKRSGGSKDLEDINLSKAKKSYFLSKESANTAMSYFSTGVDTVAEVAKQSISGTNPDIGSFALGLVAEQAIKIGAQGLLLGSIVAVKNYLNSDKSVKEQNPELIAATVASLSAEEQMIKDDFYELSTSADKVTREEDRPINDQAVEEVTNSIRSQVQEKKWEDVPINKSVLKQAREASAPAIKVIKESNNKDYTVKEPIKRAGIHIRN